MGESIVELWQSTVESKHTREQIPRTPLIGCDGSIVTQAPPASRMANISGFRVDTELKLPLKSL